MEVADESVDESPYRMQVASSNIPSLSFGENSPVTSNNGNPFSLFYSPSSSIQQNNDIQSSRASNSWIASLRSNKQYRNYSSIISNAPESCQHFYESPKRDDVCRIKKIENGAIHGRSTSIDGRLPSSSSHSLPSSSFRHWASLESIQRNQRLKQLAAQSTTKVRSLSARESTAAAERWRYIQTVLERRRKESLESRERFIRQPLDNILRQKATSKRTEPQAWDSFVVGRSILKRKTLNWRMKVSRHVRFRINQQLNDETEDRAGEIDREKLPIISIAEETEALSNNEISFTNKEDQRLPPLMTPSPRMEITRNLQGPDDAPQHVSPSGPSWVERQVAKVRQRKLWAFRQQQEQHEQQQQQQQQQQQKLNDHPSRAILKRSVSLLVNVPDERDTETDSLNEEEDEGDRSECEEYDGILKKPQSLAWEVLLDKEEFAEMLNEHIKDDSTVDSYGGWPHFPVKLAICIQQRQKNLKERKADRMEETRNDEKLSLNNSFARRKRFGKRLSIVVARQRKRKIAKRVLPSPIHQPQEIRQPSYSKQEKKSDESDQEVLTTSNSIPDDEGQSLTNAISSLQVLDTRNPLPITVDVVSEISSTTQSNEIHTSTSTPNLSSPSDLISESDVNQTALENASVSPESDAETIVADAQYHLDGLIPAADDSATKRTDHEDYDQTSGSAFCLPIVGQKWEGITDESISDVTVDDGPYHIDQQESNVMKIPQQQNDGMASRLDAIPAGISPVEQTEYHISPLVHSTGIVNKDSAIHRKLPAYCSGWPRVISNQNGDASPPSPPPMTTVSYWNNFEAPASEETMTGTINQPEVDISSEATAFALLIPGTQKDSNHPPVSPVIIQTSIDKKTKEARNASRILFPTVMSIRTQTEPQSSQGSKGDGKAEEDKIYSDSMDAKEMEETGTEECQCLHRAVLTCLLPEAAETLANLELIRRQLKKARIRRQASEQQRQPLQVRRDILTGIDPNTSTTK